LEVGSDALDICQFEVRVLELSLSLRNCCTNSSDHRFALLDPCAIEHVSTEDTERISKDAE
jgi:hypothetical protein